MKKSLTRSLGFTLIELMITVAIIVVAILAIMGRVSSTKQASQVQSELGNVQAMITASQASFAGRPDFTGLDNAYLYKKNGFPTQMTNSSGPLKPVNVWGGDVTVSIGTTPNKGQIIYAGVPAAACIDFVNSIAQSVSTIDVGGVGVKLVTDSINDIGLTSSACVGLATITMTFNN